MNRKPSKNYHLAGWLHARHATRLRPPVSSPNTPTFSIVVPAYRVGAYLRAAVESVQSQTLQDFEIIVVDDCCPDNCTAVLDDVQDARLRVIRHGINKGLAASRNTGVRASRGRFLAFLDADDLWEPRKLELHRQHFLSDPRIGLSFSRSAFMNERGEPINGFQMPVLTEISPELVLQRNPVGNGSAAVMRRDAVATVFSLQGERWSEGNLFDEQFRRSEDVECWLRFALVTDWKIEGIGDVLTRYRINAAGLSAKVHEQLASWEKVINKTRCYAPEFIAQHEHLARAYQLRYLCRQAVQHRDPAALELIHRSLRSDWRMLRREPGRTLMTLMAAYAQALLPLNAYRLLERAGWALVVGRQLRRMQAGS